MLLASLETLDPARMFVVVHWLGMLLGLGAAAAADVLGARMLLSARPGPGRHVLHRLHTTIGVAMLLLLSSGAGLIVLRADGWCALPGDVLRLGPACLPYKLAAKLVLMSALIGVALMIETWLLPLASRRQRPLILDLSPLELVRAAAIVGASFTCWTTLAAIPLIKALHSWPPHQLLACAAMAWLVAATGAGTTLVVLRKVLERWPLGSAQTHEAAATARAVRYPALVASNATTAGNGAMAWELGRPLDQPAADAGRDVAQPAHPNAVPTTGGGAAAIATSAGDRIGVPDGAPLAAANAVLRPALWGTFAISFLVNVLMLTGPLYMLQVYDRVLTSRSSETLLVLTVLVIGLFAVMGALDLIRTRILSRVAIRIDAILGPPLLAAAVRVAPQRSRAAAPSPMRDLEQIRQFVAGPAVPAMLDLPFAPLYFALVFMLHPVLGVIALAGATLLLALSIVNQIVARKPLAKSAEVSARCDGLVEAGWRGAETLRALGMSSAFRRRWLADHTEALSVQLRTGDSAGKIATATRVARLLLQSLLLGAGAWLALHDAISAGAMIAVSIIAGRALAPIEQLVAFWRSIGAAHGAMKRCRECLDGAADEDGSLELPAPKGDLVVSNLFVAPLGASQPVLKGLSFRLEPGDALAVVGPSAAGKSTLARALVGVWPPRAGDIRLDGAALSQWNPDALGRHIGYLPQDALLFDGTIGENIARLNPDARPQDVIAAARAAGVHEMILRLEQGYATRVGEGGAALPGGQRQRIALARALYGNPVLVVMDEPNANLDAAGEAALIEAIGLLRAARRTVVLMAHRRSVLAAVNRVLVLSDGRQTAFGPPEKIFKSVGRITKDANNDTRNQSARNANAPA